MEDPTSARSRIVQDVAGRYGVSIDAVEVLLNAIAAGSGSMAQFSHPDLGGMGQWSRDGMLMIGDMFNNGLKHRVDGLCTELSDLLQRNPALAPPRAGSGFGFGGWWPEEFGTPSSSGGQNDMHYAFFPATQRLAVRRGAETAVYDTGQHMISGVSQQQGGDASITFTSQFGTVRLGDLRRVQGAAESEPAAPPLRASEANEINLAAAVAPVFNAAPVAPASRTADAGVEDVFAMLERLASLRDKGIITDDEFAAKKAELLSRI